jgi:Glycosyl transferases group 1
MRLAVHNPRFFTDPASNYNGYNLAFVRLFRPLIFLNGLTRGRLLRIQGQMRACGLDPTTFEFILTERALNRRADVLINFNGFPCVRGNAPVRGFRGLKIYHAFEYVFNASMSHRLFRDGGADVLMGYANHGRHCPFFQQHYPTYVDRVIPVPFGFGARFASTTPFARRLPRVVALGAVNPVDDPLAGQFGDLSEYVAFYRHATWTHQWRHLLRTHHTALDSVMDCLLPVPPATKSFQYDAVETLNRYQLFANDEGLMNFPPARTYEGMAAGAVLVCSDHPVYDDLGLVDGVHCLRHPRHDIDGFRDRVAAALADPQALARIAATGTAMVRERYSHEAVARQLYTDIATLYAGRSSVTQARTTSAGTPLTGTTATEAA